MEGEPTSNDMIRITWDIPSACCMRLHTTMVPHGTCFRLNVTDCTRVRTIKRRQYVVVATKQDARQVSHEVGWGTHECIGEIAISTYGVPENGPKTDHFTTGIAWVHREYSPSFLHVTSLMIRNTVKQSGSDKKMRASVTMKHTTTQNDAYMHRHSISWPLYT